MEMSCPVPLLKLTKQSGCWTHMTPARPHTPEHLVVETQVEADTLSTALFVGGCNGGELAVPRLTALVPSGHLRTTHTSVPLLDSLTHRVHTHTHRLSGLGVDHQALVKVELASVVL